jgi:hypothetical membrane protein
LFLVKDTHVTVSPTYRTADAGQIRLVRGLALAGIIGPVLFVTLIVVQGFLLPDYSHVRLPISALAAWPTGWIQVLNFQIFGALTLVFAHALHRAVRRTRWGVVGYALLALTGVGLIMSGLFSWHMVDGVPRETVPHVVAAIIVFIGAGLALMLLSRRFVADPQWRDLATYTMASGIAVVVLFVMTALLAIGEGTPLHPWVGLMQRIVCGVWFACVIVIASRIRALSSFMT